MTWPIQRQVEYMSLNQCVEGKSIFYANWRLGLSGDKSI